MNEYQKLLAYLKVLYHNLTTLHRHLVKDEAWFGNHAQIGEWYVGVSDELDDLVETGLALGFQEPSIKDSVLTYASECLSCDPRGPEETFRLIFASLQKLCDLMRAAEAEVPSPVANKLQEYEYHWMKEAKYKIVSALGQRASAGGSEYDDD